MNLGTQLLVMKSAGGETAAQAAYMVVMLTTQGIAAMLEEHGAQRFSTPRDFGREACPVCQARDGLAESAPEPEDLAGSVGTWEASTEQIHEDLSVFRGAWE